MKKCGIYAIRNNRNGALYIGQTSDLVGRKYRHFFDLRNGNHENPRLQNSYNKYGSDVFSFEVILYCEPHELNYYEQKFLDKTPNLYNIHRECTYSSRGVKHSKETRKKISEKNKGNKNHLGKRHAPESILKMSLAKKGKKHSDETKKKIGEANKGHPAYSGMSGKHHSEESKKKMSESKKGKVIITEEQKRKLSDFWKRRRELKLSNHQSEK